MKTVLTTIGKFWSFDLARQLHKRDALVSIFTGYPRFKLRNENLPDGTIRPFPWLVAPYMRFGHLNHAVRVQWEHYSAVTFDSYVARNLPDCDLVSGLSGSITKTGRVAKKRGIRNVCDRGSSHIRFQDQILREEYDRQNIPFAGVDPRTIEREEEEYENADAITVPSTFALKTFEKLGVSSSKMKLAPFGVDLSRFKPSGRPPEDKFNVLFVGSIGVRKGVSYVLRAFDMLEHPRKHLTFAGRVDASCEELVRTVADRTDISFPGHQTQAQLVELMSRSHVMVLPSLEEGLALVQAQTMACRCPVIASENTGAATLFTDGVEGFITPIRDVHSVATRLQQLADNPQLRDRMAEAALNRTRSIGGWDQYGERVFNIYSEIVNQ